MKLIIKIALGIILAVVLLFVVGSTIRTTSMQSDDDKQQAEFCKKMRAQGMSTEDLTRAGCKP